MENSYSTERIGEAVYKEGLRYALLNGIPFDEIENPELSKLWNDAQKAIDDVQKFLDKELGEEFFRPTV